MKLINTQPNYICGKYLLFHCFSFNIFRVNKQQHPNAIEVYTNNYCEAHLLNCLAREKT